MNERFSMKLTIKEVRSARNENCFCGKDADYSVQLTNDNIHRPVCESCLLDRLNKPGQSLFIKDNTMVQVFKGGKVKTICIK